MNLLQAEELAQIKKYVLGKKHPVRREIELLEPKQALRIERADFKWRQRTPKTICNSISKKSKKRFQVYAIHDKSGWIVERVDDGT